MKRILGTILVAASLLMASPAKAEQYTLINAVTTNATSSTLDLNGVSKVIVQAKSAAGSVVLVSIQIRNLSSDPWFTVATVSNPDSAGQIYIGPGAGTMQVVLSGYVSGTVSVTATTTR